MQNKTENYEIFQQKEKHFKPEIGTLLVIKLRYWFGFSVIAFGL